MASESRALHVAAAAGLAAAAALLLAPLTAGAQAPPAPARTPQANATAPPAAEPWWAPVAFQGRTVSDVRVDAGLLSVSVAGLGEQQSADGGVTWHAASEPGGAPVPAAPGAWQARGGRVGRVDATGTWHADPGSPRVASPSTAGHGTVAGVPGADGWVVAVDVDGVVWRRDAAGHWDRALLLLNQDALHGAPRVTGIASFSVPLSDAVYLATDGYSVLESTDGGDDWVRAGPGLPDSVLAVTTDAPRRAVWAGTTDGLWRHHLQPTPAPPVYAAQDLRLRWVGTAAVCLAAAGVALGGMLRLLR